MELLEERKWGGRSEEAVIKEREEEIKKGRAGGHRRAGRGVLAR